MQQNLDAFEDYATQTTLRQLQAGVLETLLEKVVAEEHTNFPVEMIMKEVGIALKGQRAVDARLKRKENGDEGSEDGEGPEGLDGVNDV